MSKPGLGLKIAFGVGDIAPAATTTAIGAFLLFYYTQVLALDPALVGLALGIAVIFDAISDPLVGMISDGWRSRLGRRHPFMWFSLVPLCISFYLLFNPIDGLTELLLFTWLTVTAILTRTFMTFFSIPHLSFGAEITSDYSERTKIMSFAQIFAALGGIAFSMISYGIIFASTPEYENGLLNPDAYFELTLLALALIATGILISTGFTQKAAMRTIRLASAKERFTLGRLLRQGGTAFQNRNYRVLMSATLAFGVLGGSSAAMYVHMMTYFWGLLPPQLILVALGTMMASFFVFGMAQTSLAAHEKKKMLIILTAIASFEPTIVISLRLLDVLPENGTLFILVLVILSQSVYIGATLAKGLLHRSMIADIIDEQELTTGKRQEGLLYSVSLFCSKATSGIGAVFGGLVLSLIAFPPNVDAATIPAEVVTKMGIFMGPILGAFYCLPILIYARYDLDRARLGEIQHQLDVKRADTAPTPAG